MRVIIGEYIGGLNDRTKGFAHITPSEGVLKYPYFEGLEPPILTPFRRGYLGLSLIHI